MRWSVLEDSVRDLRHGVRVLRRAPGFTAAALVTLALGIGATSAIFSVVRTVMLEPLPYREPDRIVAVWETNRGGTVRNVIAPANFVAWRERTRTLEHLGMVGPRRRRHDRQRPACPRSSGLTVSADVFRALGVQPALGRAYTAEEDLGGNSAVIVLSHEFWQRRLGGRAGRARHDALHRRRAADGDRRDASRLHDRRTESRLPDSIRSDAGAASRRARPRQFVRHRAPARGCLVRAGVQRDAEHLRRARERGAAAQRPPDGDAPSSAGTDGRGAPAGAVRAGGRGRARAARGLRQRREPAAGAQRRARARARHAHGAWRKTRAAGAPDAHRKPGARGRRRHRGTGVAALCHRGLLALVGDRIPIPRLDQVALDLPVVAFTMVTALATGIVVRPRARVRLDEPRERCAARRRTSRRRPPVARACSARSSSPKSRCRSCCWPAPVC